jgi:hypothetical protein
VLGIDAQVVLGVRVDEPGKLHDRTASGVEDRPLDVFDVSFDAVALTGHQRDLRGAGRGMRSVFACAHRGRLCRVGASSRVGGIEARGAGRLTGCARPRSLPSRSAIGDPFLFWMCGCYGQVTTGGVIAREVLLADAANLSGHV